MGKKRNRKKLTSKGLRSKVNNGVVQAVRAGRDYFDKLAGITKAWEKNLNPWLTIQNPDKSATNRTFIRVKANDYWGKPKGAR